MASARKPDVWMPILIDKYLGDTMTLTTEQHGAYMLLLFAMWKSGGLLPDDDEKLAAAARLSPARWRAMRDTIRAFFTSDGAGGLTQKRLHAELGRAEARSVAGRMAGLASGKARSRGSTKDERSLNGSANESATEGERQPQRNANDEATSGATFGELHTHTESAEKGTVVPLSPDSGLAIEPDGSTARRAREQAHEATTAGEACKAMKAAGCQRCNPGSPLLIALLEQGATVHELVFGVERAVAARADDSFSYALKVVRSERSRAAELQLAPATDRPKSMRQRMDDWTAGVEAMNAEFAQEREREGREGAA
jgi:uncharacterized protein YdaU (DUF1376 family)